MIAINGHNHGPPRKADAVKITDAAGVLLAILQLASPELMTAEVIRAIAEELDGIAEELDRE